MDLLHAIVLGAVQGLTEFLPVSSSGHLILFQHLFGLTEPELFFDICLHLGTLIAVCAVFFKDIVAMLSALFRFPARSRETGGMKKLFETDRDFRMMVLILVATIPTGLLGVLFSDAADRIFGNLRLVGVSLLVTGTLLWITRRCPAAGRPVLKTGFKDALIVGTVQGIAILPGISRSGSTISAALLLGIDRETAGRYSFLLSLPAILGAVVLEFEPALFEQSALTWGAVAVGTVIAALVGYLSLKLLMRIVKHGRLSLFAPYCWGVGILALIYSWV